MGGGLASIHDSVRKNDLEPSAIADGVATASKSHLGIARVILASIIARSPNAQISRTARINSGHIFLG